MQWMESIDGQVIYFFGMSFVDNTWSMKSFLTKKQGISSKEADQALEIPEDFDYVELPTFMK